MRKNKVDRDEGRDISEKIALGMLKGSGKITGESLYDSRLFNQSAGMDAGFGAEDEYTAYTKPLFERGEVSGSIYRPKKSDSDAYGDVDSQLKQLSDTSRFKPDKGFKGAEAGSGAGPRDAPVQFERGSAPGGDSRETTRSPDRGRRDYEKRGSRDEEELDRNRERNHDGRGDRRDRDGGGRGSKDYYRDRGDDSRDDRSSKRSRY
jgi:hypothetical protein